LFIYISRLAFRFWMQGSPSALCGDGLFLVTTWAWSETTFIPTLSQACRFVMKYYVF